MANIHAYTAIRAYLDLMGLPSPSDADLEKTRAALLGAAAKDQANCLMLSIERDEDGTKRQLMASMTRLLMATPRAKNP